MDLNGTLSGRDFVALEQRLFGNNSLFGNSTAASNTDDEDLEVNTDVYSRVIVTVIYAALFAVGSLGNSITLYTLLSRKTLQNLQSTVHYHLASLAVSDLLILVLSMPIELYNFIWFHHPWVFGDAVCRGYYFLRNSCSYATALNIASLSVERYMAICHPFKAKSIMSRSRTKKLISAMWLASFALATPMIFVMGQVMRKGENICTSIVSPVTIKTVLQVNAFLSFVIPMVVISTLNGVIANQLLRMFREAEQENRVCIVGGNPTMLNVTVEPNRAQSLRHGVLVLRNGWYIAFVVCWLPYHARRMMFCYISEWSDDLYDFYHYFYMLTNILFYVSSAVNPILYNLVSATYRQIFFSTLRYFCVPCRQTPRMHPHPLTRHSISISSNHTLSTNIIKETSY
ncbi:LOW QUALITY PROTEIN: neurotensin receptor type 1-like [Pseudochaenichthys georgianus]|uniref:LOW QUALITY PROTEIN: neurotensin receptor type 1-like n=1 Tax=Pseudochaenichthys georgianus TaxID=52239 RepID=UPI00146C1A57|nr:LOW QUALITY PROTEIN: neurotensin receptor type 1-like [Pseudochaenichthys georgianus]